MKEIIIKYIKKAKIFIPLATCPLTLASSIGSSSKGQGARGKTVFAFFNNLISICKLSSIFIAAFLIISLLLAVNVSAEQKKELTKEEVMKLHVETKKKVDEVVGKTKDIIDKTVEWANTLKDWNDKFDSIERELNEVYDSEFDKTARDLKIVALLQKYENSKVLTSLKTTLKDKFGSIQSKKDIADAVSYYKNKVSSRLGELDNFISDLAAKAKITEESLKDASDYLKTAQTASQVYDLLRPDAVTAFTGLERISGILSLGADYMPPPLDSALKGYADVTHGFVSALKGLDKTISDLQYQGYLALGSDFGKAYYAKNNTPPPIGIRLVKEFNEIDPVQVYVDDLGDGAPVYSLEGGQVMEFGVGFPEAERTYNHYLKILPLIKEKIKAEIKIPISRFRIACRSQSLSQNIDKVAELIQKDLSASPGGVEFLSSFVSEFFEPTVANKVKAAVIGKPLADEEALPQRLRSEIGFSEGDLSSLRNLGHETLNAALAFKDDIEIKDSAKKAAAAAQASIPKIDSSMKKLNELMADPQYSQHYGELAKLANRWLDLKRFFIGLSHAETGFLKDDFGNLIDSGKIKRYNYCLKREYKDEILRAGALPYEASRGLSSSLPDGPMNSKDFDNYRKGQEFLGRKDSFGPLFYALAGAKKHPLLNENIDGLISLIDSIAKESQDFGKWLKYWKQGLDSEFNNIKTAASSRIGAPLKVKQQIESTFGFRILLPELDPGARDAALSGYIGKVETQKKMIDNFYAKALWAADFNNNISDLRAALLRAKEINNSLASENKELTKQKDAYYSSTRKYLKELFSDFEKMHSWWAYDAPIPWCEKVLGEAKARFAEIEKKESEWKNKFKAMKEKSDNTPFVYDYSGDILSNNALFIQWVGLKETGDNFGLDNMKQRLNTEAAGVRERKARTETENKNWEKAKAQAEAERARAPHAEIPISSISVCSKPVSNGSVLITQKDLVNGRFIIEGNLANVRNGTVDRISYLINNVDYARSTKGGSAWKLILEEKEVPSYEKLEFAIFAHIDSYRSDPAKFIINYSFPKKETKAQIGSLLSDSRLKFRLDKAAKLFRETSTMMSYFRFAVSKNDLGFAKTLYLSILDRKDASVSNKQEADDIYSSIAAEGQVNPDTTSIYKQVTDYDFDIRNFYSDAEKTLSNLVPDLANLKNISGNVGESFILEDVVAGKGPVPGGGGGSASGKATFSVQSYFDFSAGSTTKDPNQGDVFFMAEMGGRVFTPGSGAVRDMGTSDFSSAPTMSTDQAEVALTVGHYYAALTTEQKYAKFKLTSMSSESISIDWWYQDSGSTQF